MQESQEGEEGGQRGIGQAHCGSREVDGGERLLWRTAERKGGDGGGLEGAGEASGGYWVGGCWGWVGVEGWSVCGVCVCVWGGGGGGGGGA